MIALIQRVTRASVSVDNATVGEIGAGLLVLLGWKRAMTSRNHSAGGESAGLPHLWR